jgi:hypothetical protein
LEEIYVYGNMVNERPSLVVERVTTGLGLLEVCRCIVTTLVKDDFAFALSVTFDTSLVVERDTQSECKIIFYQGCDYTSTHLEQAQPIIG